MFNTVIAISAGALVLLGLFFPGLVSLRVVLLTWASILAGFALLAGVLNLLSVHWQKVTQKQKGGFYSLLLIVTFVITIAAVAIGGPVSSGAIWVYRSIQLPVETSLLALLAITLAVASLRLLRKRSDIYSVIFIIIVLIALAGAGPLYWLGEIKLISSIRDWIAQAPAAAGMRGLLIGIALGTIATGLRVLMGADRPYGGG